jgi:cation diffusion facilitator CzcD-associated flavoprotein CzcO
VTTHETHTAVVVGAGFSGVAAAARLLEDGVDDVLVLERAGDVGGAWRDNTYPGCVCDVPSHLYSLSFAPNPHWSRRFAPQPEIWNYLREVADRTGVRARTRFRTELREASWDDRTATWRLETTAGPVRGRVLVLATGALSEPATPALPGRETFPGPVFHSARWPRGLDLTGARVAVAGTGASAVQIVPALADTVRSLHLFQRTPAWVLPRGDRPVRPVIRRLHERWPLTQRLARQGQRWGREISLLGFQHPALGELVARQARRRLARQVPDPALRAALTPSYSLGCKRILLSDDFWPTLTRPHVHLVPSPVREVVGRTVVAADGTAVDVDAVVLATGFRVTDPPVARLVRGRDLRTLAEAWGGSPRAYLGTTVAGFPNLFLLLGPGTGLAHSSVLLMAEAQVEHLRAAVRAMAEHGLVALEPRVGAQDAFVDDLDRRLAGTVWQRGGCTSWYRDRTGRLSALWPGSISGFERRLRRPRPTDYLVRRSELDPGRRAATLER